MNRLLLLLVVLLSMGTGLHAQKAKFKNRACTVQQARLPLNLTQPEQRTYDIVAKGRYASNVDAHGKRLYGWRKDTENPNVKAVVSLYGYSVASPKKHSEKKQTKDKEGNVTKTWTEYWYTSSSTGKGTLYIYGLSNPFEYKSKRKKKSKAQERADAAAAAKKEDLADNPFLTDDVIAEAEESDEGADEGLADAELNLVKTINLDKKMNVSTGRHRSSSAAYKDYTDNQRPKLNNQRTAYPGQVYKSAMNSLNAQYGFAPVNNRFYLKHMKTEKHKEYKTWNDACQAVETIFKTFSYNEQIDPAKFDPIVSYFEGQVNSIPANDKKAKNHRKAAYENLLNVLYYLDRHDDVIAWSEKFMEDKKLDNVAKRMVNKSDRTKALLAFHGMESCHFETDEVVDAEDIEVSEDAVSEESDAGNK